MPRDGQAYLHKIAGDGRDVRLYGQRVVDVTRHPAFKNAVREILGEIASEAATVEIFVKAIEATFVLKNHAYHAYDWDRSAALLDILLSSYSLDDEPGAVTAVEKAT